MRRLIVIAALIAATAAHAQPARRGEAAPGDGPAPGPRLYISPAGEPFRQGDGLKAWFAAADADHDGRLTPTEFRADATRFFKTLDKDGDGQLRGLELQAYERETVPEIMGVYGDGALAFAGRGRGRAREGAGRFSLLNIPQPVTGADLDGDRRVTAAEFEKSADIRFDLLDKAKAGALTLEALVPPAQGRRRRR